MLTPGAVQMSGGDGGAEGVHHAAAAGIAGAGGAMPHIGAIQQAFGRHDMSGVQSHVGGDTKQSADAMGASAYATGNHVAFGRSPDLHTAAHEAAHVVQQRACRSRVGSARAVTATRTTQIRSLTRWLRASRLKACSIRWRVAAAALACSRRLFNARTSPAAAPTARRSRTRRPTGVMRSSTSAKPSRAATLVHPTPGETGFGDGSLENARVHFCGQLGVAAKDLDVYEEAEAESESEAAASHKAPAPEQKGGDSSGKDLGGAPAWFNVFQINCILSGEWTKDQKVIQILVTAYLKAAHGDVPANVAAFFEHCGKSEQNNQAKDFDASADIECNTSAKTKGDKMKKTENWCQSASSSVFARGLNNCGYTLKPRPIPAAKQKYFGGATNISDQTGLAGLIASEINSFMPPNPDDKSKKGAFSGAMDCWAAGVEPGDMMSFVSGGSALAAAGHVVTIISCDSGEESRTLSFVSGNAGSSLATNGSIRAESATWEKPPGPIDLHKDRPKDAASVWIWSITKRSQVSPTIIDRTRSDDPGKLDSFYHMSYDPSKDKRVGPPA